MSESKYTFELVWQALMESREQIKQLSAEADKRSAETDKQIKVLSVEANKRSAETDKRIKELSRNIAGIADSNGKMAEQAIYNTLERDMKFAGIDFDYIDKNKKRMVKSLGLKAEYDVIMYNGDTIALIETKYQVQKKDVIKLVTKQVGNFRKLFKEYASYKIVLGVGGSSFDTDAEQEAEDNGVGIIKIINDKVEYFTDNIRIY